MDQAMYMIEPPKAVFAAVSCEPEGSGPELAAEEWLWLRGAKEVEAVLIALGDVGLLKKRVQPVDFLFEQAEACSMGRAAAAGRVPRLGSRCPVPDDESRNGLAAALLGLAIDAPRLVERIETTTQWVELEDVAEGAQGGAEVVLVRTLGEPG